MHFQSVVASHCTYADESISTQHGQWVTLRRAMRRDIARHEGERRAISLADETVIWVRLDFHRSNAPRGLTRARRLMLRCPRAFGRQATQR